MVKEQFREPHVAKLSHMTFGFMTAEEMKKAAHIQVVEKQLYNEDHRRIPFINGTLDTRMGTSLKGLLCETCGQDVSSCVGHFGYIDLELPCFHIGFLKVTVKILQMICKYCSAILLPVEAKLRFQENVRKPSMDYLQRKSLHQKIFSSCRKVSVCPECGEINGTVKKFSVLKVIHEKFGKKPKAAVMDDIVQAFDIAVSSNRELQALATKHVEILDPERVLRLFQNIRQGEAALLMVNRGLSNPAELILTRIPVSPPCIRPSVMSSLKSGTNEDDITMKMTEILLLNQAIRLHRGQGANTSMVTDDWDYLQLQVALMINSETSGIPLHMLPTRTMRGFVQRLKGKQGRFRGTLSGKRVDYTGRTVISPDPNLQIDQVGIPVHIAKLITYEEEVNAVNIEKLRKLVRNGSSIHPGAESIQDKVTKFKKSLYYGDHEQQARNLKLGDIVQRHMLDGDMVLFNRQPSLHKLSVQAFRVKVMPHRTFRFNECCCNPFNADFDGDEMNIHMPQTEEAKAEALLLMGSKSNIVTPKNGEPLIAAIQDFITGAFLLTQKDNFFKHSQASQLISSILGGKDSSIYVSLPPPAILKPEKLWTGKQIFSLLMQPNKNNPVKVNLETKNKSYTKRFDEKLKTLYEQDEPADLCACDGYVVIRNSQLLCGVMDKVTLGSGSKNNIFYNILRFFGEDCAADALARLSKLTPACLTVGGFSIGLEDVTPGANLLLEKNRLLENGRFNCKGHIQQYNENSLKTHPGCNEEETLEAVILKELSNIRESAGQVCLRELPKNNSPLVMAVCGSKGSNINISQMIACVGQQAISGKRVPSGFEDRSLPHFCRQEKSADARGFVENSFHSGLIPSEFFFHTMAGREGLVDTAVKTAETGYMQRRLVKSLEDLSVKYDSTVRTCMNEVVQFVYGGDNLDPAAMEADSKPINFKRLWNHSMAVTNNDFRNEKSLTGHQLLSLTEDVLLEEKWATRQSGFDDFKDDIRKYIGGVAEKLTKLRHPFEMSGKQQPDVLDEVSRVTKSQALQFLDSCLLKYSKAVIQPGEAVGAVTAQSVGEPATQMTLKTFHFAGVASMNITLGVPRIREIINASKIINTPIIKATLDEPHSLDSAHTVKGRIDKTTLDQVSLYIQQVMTADVCCIEIKLAMKIIKTLKLEVNQHSIRKSLNESILKIDENDVEFHDDLMRINVSCTTRSAARYRLSYIESHLNKVVIKGVPGVTHAVICHDETSTDPNNPKYHLVVDGDNFRGVMGTRGVNGVRTTSNNIMDVFKCLGIEAARKTIMNEIIYTLEEHGLSIDIRHNMLLADLMTHTGDVLGITRFGMAKLKESVLMLASFEKTSDHLFEAAYHGQKDVINGVSESVIMGVPMNLGTGALQLMHASGKPAAMKRSVLFERPEFHIPEFQDVLGRSTYRSRHQGHQKRHVSVADLF